MDVRSRPAIFGALGGAVAVLATVVCFVYLRGSSPDAGTPAFSSRESQSSSKSTNAAATDNPAPSSKADLESRVAMLEAQLAELQRILKAGGGDDARVHALEKAVTKLQVAMDGVSIETASVDRHALFSSENGYVKADEYFEAGKFAIAGEGYLTFYQKHPQHADARDVLKKARDSFLRAGYKDKALWVQEEMMKNFPQHRAADLWEQATLEKDAGLYDQAINHAAQAAEMAPSQEDRLWKRLYWAWYVQLRDGAPAGIAALQEVQKEIATSGVTNPKLAENAARRMSEWQKLLESKR